MAPERIAVLGGGLGSLSAVFEITEEPGWQQKYAITVYQMGWRLGGKGASGRDIDGHHAVLEHGLHLFPGFYDNTFHLMRRVYDRLARPAGHPIRTADDAFLPLNHVHVGDAFRGRWRRWRLDFPPNPRVPGIGDAWELSPKAYFRAIVPRVVDALRSLAAGPGADRTDWAGLLARLQSAAAAGMGLAADLRETAAANAYTMSAGSPDAPGANEPLLLRWLDEVRERLQAQQPFLQDGDDRKRRFMILAELGTVLCRGMIADGILTRGFDHLDDEEWTGWLRRHGASELVTGSGVVRACYDFCFGYEDGDPARRCVAAGAGSRMLLRLLLTYKGSLFFKMRASMGDTIFAPLYEILAARGVAFRFFHRVRSVSADASGRRISEIEISRQAEPVSPGAAYRPLVTVKGLPSWPAEPLYEQLRDGGALAASGVNLEDYTAAEHEPVTTLTRGTHFDNVILGISIGALPVICADLARRSPAWKQMIATTRTVATQASQLWLTADARELGWEEAGTSTTALAKPLDTMADMSHVIAAEDWPPGEAPRSVAYFCAALPGPADDPSGEFGRRRHQREQRRVAGMVGAWEAAQLPGIWPRFREGMVMRREYRANINPSDRYVQTVPGSPRYRLAADASGFDNLYLAGDWVKTGINGGCAEAATMAGLAAARGLTGRAIIISGERDDGVRDESRGAFALTGAGLTAALGYAVGEIEAAGVTLVGSRQMVGGLLPRGLRLAPQGITDAAVHPLCVMFARHRNVRPSFVPVGGWAYREFVVAIPFVEHTASHGPPGPMVFWPKVYVSDPVPSLLGLPYGFPKLLASLDFDRLSFTVANLSGHLLASAELRLAGPPAPIATEPNWAITRQMIEQPTISVDPLGLFHYSYMEMNLDSARFRPLEGELRVDAALPTLPAGTHPVDSIAAGPLGGFLLRTRWTLTNFLQSAAVASAMRRRG